MHLAGFMVSGNPKRSPRTTFIVMGFESVEQTVDFVPSKPYLTYTRINRWEKDTAFCDAYVWDYATSSLVMQCINLRYQELPRVVWKSILEGHHSDGSKETAVAPAQAASRESMNAQPAVVAAPGGTPKSKAEKTQQQVASLGPDTFQHFLESIAKSTGVDVSDLTDDMQLAEIGVDSIMAIEVASMVRERTGEELPATFRL